MDDIHPEENNSGRLIAATTTILIIATLLFALRLFARSLTPAKRGWDDYVLSISYVLLIGLLITLYVGVTQADIGHHLSAVEPDKQSRFLFILYFQNWFYLPSSLLSRISVVLLYLRVFTNKWARAACWAVIAFLVANCVAMIITAQLQCIPFVYTFEKGIDGECFDQWRWYEVSNFPNIFGDVLVLVLPIRTVWTIKASAARKAGIAAVFLTGSIGIIASSVRASVFYHSADVIINDSTFAEAPFSWTAIECGFYFSAACLVALRPLFTYLPRVIKDRVLHLTEEAEGIKEQGVEELRPTRCYDDPYVTIDSSEGITKVSYASTASTARGSPEHHNAIPGRNEIHVETDIHITRE
ncbi:hypothetical protein GGR51DRAFT_507294 [Nemania sp. FL0031]|nr:hypothetical protein GGR51DRAFT_507294 [Nemania sp. FL0031]